MGNQPDGMMARWENVQVGKRQSGIMGGGKMAWWENDIGKMGRILTEHRRVDCVNSTSEHNYSYSITDMNN